MDGRLTTARTLAGRIRGVRRERYGDAGSPVLAAELGLPPRTWRNYESGVMMPATVLLRFIAATGADAHWLLTGRGQRYVEERSHRSGVPQGRPCRAGGS
jgi:hypothetical protein